MNKREKLYSMLKYIIQHTMFAYIVAFAFMFGAGALANAAINFVGGWAVMTLLGGSAVVFAIGFLAGVGTVFYHFNKILRKRAKEQHDGIARLHATIAQYRDTFGKLN